MEKLLKYIDWAFCLVMVPLMTLVFPIGRWMRDCLPYAVLLILIFYLAYFLNRRLTVPSLFRGHWGCAVIIVGGFTAVVAMLTCYHEGWPYYHLSLIYPHVDPDKVKMSQQRVWLAFVVLQLLSITVGLLDELFRQRSRFRQKLSRMREQKPAAPFKPRVSR